MPTEYEIGSDQWMYNVYSSFMDPTDPIWNPDEWEDPMQGEWSTEYDYPDFPDEWDWYEAGTGWGNAIQIGSLANWNVGNQYTDPTSIWEEEYGEFTSPFIDPGYMSMPVLLDLDTWLSDWHGYTPRFNTQDIVDASKIGGLQKKTNVEGVLKDIGRLGDTLENYIYSGGDDNFQDLYDKALATGRLSDFATQANIYDIEQSFISDFYSSVGEMASQGAFDWGDAPNESDYWFTTVDPGSNISQLDETSEYCDQQCYSQCTDPSDPEGVLCEECWSDCLSTA